MKAKIISIYVIIIASISCTDSYKTIITLELHNSTSRNIFVEFQNSANTKTIYIIEPSKDKSIYYASFDTQNKEFTVDDFTSVISKTTVYYESGIDTTHISRGYYQSFSDWGENTSYDMEDKFINYTNVILENMIE